jgi:hypothetical protein
MSEELNQAKLETSFGGKAVGLKFNPSGNKEVEEIKSDCAKLINVLHALRNETEDGEKKRMYSVAITEIQTAQMWAVKANTWGQN